MDIILSKDPVDLQESDVLVVGLFSEERPLRGSAGWIDWRLNGKLSRLLIDRRLTGEWREKTLIPSQGRITSGLILLFGLGKAKEYSYLSVRKFFPFFVETLRNLNASHIGLSLPYGDAYNVDCGKLAEILIEGFMDSLDSRPSNRGWVEGLTLSFAEGEEQFGEIFLGIQTAQSILKERLPIRILTPSAVDSGPPSARTP